MLDAENPGVPPNEPKLESWGEIAAYLRRDIRTVQRWEKEIGLPVRRLMIGKQGQVYAYRSELDRWVLQRQPKAENGEPSRIQEVDPPEEPGSTEETPRNARRFWKVTVALLVVVAGVVTYFAIRRPGVTQIQRTPQSPTRILLFVRPFTSGPGEKEFVQGLTYELITQLGRVSPDFIGVFAPTTSQELGEKSILELKRLLSADFVLEGSVRRGNEQLRIDIDLVSAADQTPSWTNSYTGDLQNVLAFQDKVATDVANHLFGALPDKQSHAADDGTVVDLGGSPSKPSRQLATGPVQPDVYQHYLVGRVYLLDRNFPRSMDSFQKALQIDPSYAPALADLAMSVLLLGEAPNDAIPPSKAFPDARRSAELALANDPRISDAYRVLANIAQGYDHDLGKAEQLYKTAIEIDPRNVTALKWYSDFLFVSNRLPEASEQIDKALEIDPYSPLLNTAKAEVKYYGRDFDAAISQAQRTVDQYPDFILARLWLASAYRQKKMYPQALEIFDELRKKYPTNAALLMAYGHTRGISGDRQGAQKVLNELIQESHTRYIPPVYIAGLYVSLGDLEHAFHWLDQAFAAKSDRLVYLGVDPIADPLRQDPRFASLMKKVGLPGPSRK